MPEQTDTYISSFPDAESITDADKVTGIQGNANKNFTFSSILAWFVNAVKSAFVPVSRTINGVTLDTNITLTAQDVGARPDTWTPSAADVGAIPTTAKGAPLGVAELDSNGQVPSSQLDLSGKQDEITASGILKGDGQGGVAAAVAGTDYQAPLTAGTDYATPAQLADKAAKADLTSIQATGTTNTTGAAIPAGAYFYLNGILCRAKEQIGTNVPFTVNTNCEPVPEGGLNDVAAPVGTDGADIYIRRIGKMVFVAYRSNVSPTAIANTIKTGLPIPDSSKSKTWQVQFMANIGVAVYPAFASVNSSGELVVSIVNNGAWATSGTYTCSFELFYVTA